MSIAQFSAEWEEGESPRQYRYFTRRQDALDWAKDYAEERRVLVYVFDNTRDRYTPFADFDGRAR